VRANLRTPLPQSLSPTLPLPLRQNSKNRVRANRDRCGLVVEERDSNPLTVPAELILPDTVKVGPSSVSDAPLSSVRSRIDAAAVNSGWSVGAAGMTTLMVSKELPFLQKPAFGASAR
jgi:hypothetical protein